MTKKFKGVFFHSASPSTVDFLHLLSYRFLMHFLKDRSDEVRAHAAESTLRASLVENLVVARGLKDSQEMLYLVMTYLTADSHKV